MIAEKDNILKRQKFKCARCGKDIGNIPQHLEKYRHFKALCKTCHTIKIREERAKILKQKQKKIKPSRSFLY